MHEIINSLSDYGMVVGALAIFGVVLQWKAQALNRRAELRAAARDLTAKFYGKADSLLGDEAISETLKAVLYDVLVAVTIEEVGTVAFEVLVDTSLHSVGSSQGGAIASALTELRGKAPELADDFNDAIRDAFAAILCAHAHSDERVMITFVTGTNHQDQLVRYAERVASRIGSILPSAGKRYAVA